LRVEPERSSARGWEARSPANGNLVGFLGGLLLSRTVPPFSEAEKDQQVDSGPFDAAERRPDAHGLRVGVGGAEAKDARDRVLDRRLVVGFLAELPAEACDEPRRDLFADRHLRAAAQIAARLQLEYVEPHPAL